MIENISTKKTRKQMKKALIYGNCQSFALHKFLINSPLADVYHFHQVPAVHNIEQSDLNYLYRHILPQLDLVIIQPIQQNYKNNYFLSTYSIISQVPQKTIIIVFPVAYFTFYHPQMTYLKNKRNKYLHQPIDYHDKLLVKTFLETKRKINYKSTKCLELLTQKYLENILNPNYYEREKLVEIVINNLLELKKREQKMVSNQYFPLQKLSENQHFIIVISDFIKENYKREQLFYSINHPSKYFFRYLANSILEVLNFPKTQFPDELDPLNEIQSHLYQSLDQIIEFDFNPLKTIFKNQQITIQEYVEKFYDQYWDISSQEFLEVFKKNNS